MEPCNSFRLFDLPPELWIRICRLAVECEDAITVHDGGTQLDMQHKVYQPAITRTCNAIRTETLAHFYTTNEINYLCPTGRTFTDRLKPWLEAVGSETRSNITSCAILVTWYGNSWERIKERFLEFFTTYALVCELPFILIPDEEWSKQVFEAHDEQTWITTKQHRFRVCPLSKEVVEREADRPL